VPVSSVKAANARACGTSTTTDVVTAVKARNDAAPADRAGAAVRLTGVAGAD
jgi:hypothetical protein